MDEKLSLIHALREQNKILEFKKNQEHNRQLELKDKVRALREKTPIQPTYVKLTDKTWQEAKRFYRSAEWKKCRNDFLEGKELRCVYCYVNLSGDNKKLLNVDHKLPLRYYWDKRLDESNLQITCQQCNLKKGQNSSPDISEQKQFDLKHRNAPRNHWRNPKYWQWLNKKKV